MYSGSAQGVVERVINVRYYYYYYVFERDRAGSEILHYVCERDRAGS